MIGFLKGKLQAIKEDCVIVDVHGVGYRVTVSRQSLEELGALGSTVELEIATIVREDALDLYGFTSELDYKVFHLLLMVSGIGPRQAINIISNSRPKELAEAIIDMDSAHLQTIRGLGKKTADKIILELREPMRKLMQTTKGVTMPTAAPWRQDLFSAMTQLGYRRSQIEEALSQLTNPAELELEEAIRNCLRLLAKGRSSNKTTTA